MMDPTVFSVLLAAWGLTAAIVFVMLFFISAPYGKISRSGWGPKIQGTAAWLGMEAVSLAGIWLFFLTGGNRTVPYLVCLGLWSCHYVYRALIFPFLRRGKSSGLPLAVMLSGMGFNLLNTFFNGWWLFHGDAQLGAAWFGDIRFIAGVTLFVAGFALNVHSDHVLRDLRRDGDRSYKIPRRGFFRFVSCPNYLGEILEWIGWAVLTWSWAGATFALWTIANLAPRAVSYHVWYRKSFPDYPEERKALIPFLF
jgi:3-oxo-5-alpha-steroid 4-dehydrogenase 1